MKRSFQKALSLVLKHEGGYSNHPKDPGGATNMGITQRVYTAFGGGDVRGITHEDVAKIYKAQYWDHIRADELPTGVDYAVFDFAVNSGPARAAKYLQGVLGVTQDGHIGEITLAAAGDADAGKVINELCDTRLAFMRRLKTWNTFGKGWSRRVADVRHVSLSWTDGSTQMELAEAESMPVLAGPEKTDSPEKTTVTLSDMLRNPQAITSIGGAASGAAALANGDGPVQYAIAAAMVVAVLAGVFLLVRRSK